jgi:hypothetical protein
MKKSITEIVGSPATLSVMIDIRPFSWIKRALGLRFADAD